MAAAGIQNLLAAFGAIAEDLGLEAVLERVAAAACQLADARFGALGVIGPDQRLSHFITVGLDGGEIRRIGPLPTGHGVLGLLITEPQPLRLADLRRHPLAFGFPAYHPQMTSFLGVPIRVHDRVFGNLYLTRRTGKWTSRTPTSN
ncbi:GAF domain-containing protein [Arthrobacter sedimenti]|uniref:GAF domain-containing protein n=1 Tax=Arthrobacter sedimenti TaxID=2694931 RepID=UPI001423D2B2|nr:GAF domain-containing protein [Arthrobacter sedimenti]